MSKPGPIFLTIALCAAASSCGSPSGPSDSPMAYQGEWNGTTSQGRSIAVVVSENRACRMPFAPFYHDWPNSIGEIDRPFVSLAFAGHEIKNRRALAGVSLEGALHPGTPASEVLGLLGHSGQARSQAAPNRSQPL